MQWINFLHFYQPANMDERHIREAAEKSYKRVINALENNPGIKFTANISGCLILRLEELGYGSLLKRIIDLSSTGRLELVGSAAYHPLLPLIPKAEAIRQIKEDEEIKKKYFGKDCRLQGFFFPEMAYSPDVAVMVKKRGYMWTILDEISHSGSLGKIDAQKVYSDENSGLSVIFRNRKISNAYVPDELLKSGVNSKTIVISATDGELYGLRHEDPTKELERVLRLPGLETKTISNFIAEQKNFEKVKLISSNWNATEEELKNNISYSLWQKGDNPIQTQLWRLANLAYKTVQKNSRDANYEAARWHLVRGLSSCTFWWASASDFRVFGPLSWNPDEIEKGVNDLTRTVRSLHDSGTMNMKIKAEKLSAAIRKQLWITHWQKYWRI
jgi:alpha-amylase/alpha-mannosidase (GH57 family)